MTFKGFEGPAGTGKTHELIEAVRTRMALRALAPYQRILFLTFMHGSRRRLLSRLASYPELKLKSDCLTVDSFAAHILHRWRASVEVAPDAKQFDEICNTCGALLEQPHISRWVAATYPIIAIDEAQELRPCRLRIIRALASHTHMFVAADEYQCLDQETDTAPFMEWFHTGHVSPLTQVRRTNRPGLLSAGIAIRQGNAPAQGTGLKIQHVWPAQAPFSIGHILNSTRGQSTAVLVAPGARAWADSMIYRWNQGLQSANQTVHPIRVSWEDNSSDEAAKIAEQVFGQTNELTTRELFERLKGVATSLGWMRNAISSVDLARRAHGRTEWSKDKVAALFERKASSHRAFGHVSSKFVPVMSIHGAKNRQFRNVILLWAHGAPADGDQRKRLLYNAITRAEYQCTIFVRSNELLNEVPFA